MLVIRKNYPMLDIIRYVAAVSVILIHCGKLVDNELVHFFLKSTFARLAVPLFLISTSYFLKKGMNTHPEYGKNYFFKQGKQYLFWSLIYLPYGIHYLYAMNLSPVLYPIGLLVGLFYIGTCYHLWYFPALFSSIFLTNFIKKRRNYLFLLAISGGLFLVGASETYSSFLENTFLQTYYTSLHNFVLTTRNGLFYSFIYVVLGYLIADFEQSKFFKTRVNLKLFLSLALFSLECIVIFNNQGADKNFSLSSPFVVTFLFISLLQSNTLKNSNFFLLRQYSRYLFFLHPLFLEVIKWFIGYYGIQVNGLSLFFSTFFLTTLFSAVILYKEIMTVPIKKSLFLWSKNKLSALSLKVQKRVRSIE